MAHSRPKRFTNWYLREWLGTLGVSQADLVGKTDLSKTTISLLVNARQDYDPTIVQTIADALNVRPYELLMQPEDAMALRRLRKDAIEVVEHSGKLEAARGTGTDG
ncbi:helix-turn-helix domain-containing protein [Sphingomonas baiyangensis]|uniref:Helix-turn-helix domain-containing protein n=1 Tax=Sphingomonas baiyangensis TaxID=2572576 RepID=A0A4U1L2E5_9SPHN|nr:helix-turn-helix transcriptional regulator [Sphingomonas baiyangensis]TKD50196.1 helix-turn-helix domain-containing protein [Sphingomonas baiyangensis]